MAYSDAQNKASIKYVKKALDRIEIRVPKGTKAIYQKEAERQNKSLQRFIIDSIEKGME